MTKRVFELGRAEFALLQEIRQRLGAKVESVVQAVLCDETGQFHIIHGRLEQWELQAVRELASFHGVTLS